ncbi:hypothetical protein K2173_025088 [Erythroxylum novogranatense]|uniref:Uncharacterized protein n=1 Tax=Erythroxylum novogranatense TaxID=1862640 RepID=A0AAV8SVE5_9ROSI|nr:hypothetical protein K2173_025088 [Erythroxylum novogranatense]
MTTQPDTVLLEEWLRSNSGVNMGISTSNSSSSSARAIINAWAELRDSLQHQSFQLHHLQSLKTLVDSRFSLHVADPQAKLLISILSSQALFLPGEAYPLLLRLLYIWVRKSFRPSLALVDSVLEVLSTIFAHQFSSEKTHELFSEGVLLLGAFSFVPTLSEKSRTVCLELLCRLMEEEYRLISSSDILVSYVLAGVGYALCSANVHFVRILNAFLEIWGKEGGPRGSVSHGLMILHLVEWVVSGIIRSRTPEKLQTFVKVTLETSVANYVPFALVMTAAGTLRALNRTAADIQGMQILSLVRISAENRIELIAIELISKTKGFSGSDNDHTTSHLLLCTSLALARAGSVSSRSSLLVCLTSALLTEIFPLRRLYKTILGSSDAVSGLAPYDTKEHINSIPFKEAGAISGILCNQYIAVDGENRVIVESMIWRFCQELYLGHRQVALLLRGKEDELLGDIEKIAESAFLMVVVFSLTVSKHKLTSKLLVESQMETSISILVAFSFMEYFRRMHLPEYMDTIRGVVVSIQENKTACISFVESMPSYTNLTKPPELLQKLQYLWFKDEVQTSRILFYLRVIPTFIDLVPTSLFSGAIAPTMFLYMEHPNGKVARTAHSIYVAFLSAGKDSDDNEKALLKEKLAFYYMQRSLAEYPGCTPFEGMASGVVALVRNLPAGSPAIFYCIHSVVEKANRLCRETSTEKVDIWKNWQGETGPCRKIVELILRLISLVDIQVLPQLMKLLAQLIVELPKEGQNVVLNELYTLVAESEDVTRKPTLVSWLQSLAYLCSMAASGSAMFKANGSKKIFTLSSLGDHSDQNRMNARL